MQDSKGFKHHLFRPIVHDVSRSRLLRFLMLLLILTAIPFTMLLTQQQQETRKRAQVVLPAGPILAFVPPSITLSVNSVFTVNLTIRDAGRDETTGVTGAELNFTYPATKLELLSIAPLDADMNPFFRNVIRPATIAPGTGSIVLGVIPEEGPQWGNGTVVVLRFRAREATGTSPAQISLSGQVAGVNGSNVLQSLPAPISVTITGDGSSATDGEFSLACAGSIQANQRQSGSTTVTAERLTNVTGLPFTLLRSVSGLPAGATAAWRTPIGTQGLDNSCNPFNRGTPCTRELHISTSATTPVGTYVITISGSARISESQPTLERSGTANCTLQVLPPATPTATLTPTPSPTSTPTPTPTPTPFPTPTPGPTLTINQSAVSPGRFFTLSWSGLTARAGYRYQLESDPSLVAFVKPITQQNCVDYSFNPPTTSPSPTGLCTITVPNSTIPETFTFSLFALSLTDSTRLRVAGPTSPIVIQVGTTPQPTSTPIPTATPRPTATPVPTTAPTATRVPPTPTTVARIPGDINGNGVVDILDYAILVRDFCTSSRLSQSTCPTNSPADFNGDRVVNSLDYTTLVQNYGRRS